MKPKKPVDEWPWVTKARAAEACGYSVRNFSERIQPKIGAGGERGSGAKLRINVVMAVSALVAHVAELNRPKPEDIDPLMGGEGEAGDALEEYRREATIEKRLKNMGTRRDVVDRRRLFDALTTAFGAAQGRGKKLVKMFGNDAGELWNESINAMRDKAIKALQSDDDADDRPKQ